MSNITTNHQELSFVSEQYSHTHPPPSGRPVCLRLDARLTYLRTPRSNMPQFIMKSTHPEHEDFGKPGWRDDILVFCNNYK